METNACESGACESGACESGACEAADFFPLEQVPGSVDTRYVSMHLHICSPTFWLSTVHLCPLPTFETLQQVKHEFRLEHMINCNGKFWAP